MIGRVVTLHCTECGAASGGSPYCPECLQVVMAAMNDAAPPDLEFSFDAEPQEE